VKKFDNNVFQNKNLVPVKIPHMGWNTIRNLSSPLMEGVLEESFVYFVHSYNEDFCEETIAATEYINPFSAELHKNNFYGVQFHAEKSAATGERILSNFLNNS
jgi:glutamine amidotransferase